MATTTTTNTQTGEEHHVKTLDSVPVAATAEGGGIAPTPSTDSAKDAPGETKAGAEDPEVTVKSSTESEKDNENDGAPVNDTQKKIRRAERFGLPVQLSEEEKRNSRAERFGTAPGSQASDATKKSEELKRKARAERFGTTKSTTDEEERKKARLARFASAPSTDPVEEEKKKARALRFSEAQVNGNGKVEANAAIAGKAGGEA